MSQIDQAGPQSPGTPTRAPGTPTKGCFAGILAVAIGGVVLVAVVSFLGFLFLPKLIQGPLKLNKSGAVGYRLPDLQLQPLTGASQPITLASLSGKVAVVNFWGTWCGPCRMELPHIVHLQEVFGARPDFRLLAVSCRPPGSGQTLDELRTDTQSVLEHSHFDMPTYADEGMVTRRAFDSLQQFEGYPTTLVMDRKGVIRRVWVGFDPRMPKQIEPLIKELLAEPEG